MKKNVFFGLVAALFLMSFSPLLAAADVTGDFKITGLSYTGDVATVSGTVNHGAIQSKKNVNVEITFDYAFKAEKTVTTPGETITEIIGFIPGKCVTGVPNTNGCFEKDGVTPKDTDREEWTGTPVTETRTTEPTTVTYTFDGSKGMTANTEPTIEKGRLNPKGKITGYNWASTLSIVPNAALVDSGLIPDGYELVPASVVIVSVSYIAYLTDSYDNVITDTLISGDLY